MKVEANNIIVASDAPDEPEREHQDASPVSSSQVFELANITPSQPSQSGSNGTVLPAAAPIATTLTEYLQTRVFGRIRWDSFSRRIVIEHGGKTEPKVNHHVVAMLDEIARHVKTKPRKSELEDAIERAAHLDSFDSAQDWLAALPTWDGVPRIEQFLPTYLKTKNGRYEKAVGRYWWTAMVARIQIPGCKADMVPVLVSDKGYYKSDLLDLMPPSPEWRTDAALTESRANIGMKLIGKTLLTWEGMRGIKGRVDADEVKAFITSKYFEVLDRKSALLDRIQRQFVIVATSDRHDFLRGSSGHRRYLPFDIGRIDVSAFTKDKIQLWSEALQIVRDRLSQNLVPIDYVEAEKLAPNVHAEYEKKGQWVSNPILQHWLRLQSDGFSTDDALRQVTGISRPFTQIEQKEMADTLRHLKYKQQGTRVNGKPMTRWHKIV